MAGYQRLNRSTIASSVTAGQKRHQSCSDLSPWCIWFVAGPVGRRSQNVLVGSVCTAVMWLKLNVSLKVVMPKLAAWPLPVSGFPINLLLSTVALKFINILG